MKTINVIRRAEQKHELLALRGDEVICSSDEDIAASERNHGQEACLDAVGREMTKKVGTSVRWEGQVFVYGVLPQLRSW